MNKEEQDYIDKKFADIEHKYLNPDPEEAWQRAKKYQRFYLRKYSKVLLIGAVAMLIAMAYSFHLMGLF